jgi:cell division protein FtsZ
VIINVTGGPDLTLAEVSEASDIIATAAHEEANIIFGSVIDPAMEGRVKITVIATGFDSDLVSMSPSAQSAKATPTDLAVYAAAAEALPERPAANASRFVLARRPTLDLPVRQTAKVAAGGDAEDMDESSPLDVPAFLRRQEA